MTLKIESFDLPAPWLSPLFNGDWTGCADGEEAAIRAFMGWMVEAYGSCRPLGYGASQPEGGAEGWFAKHHDADQWWPYGGTVIDVQFDVTKQP